MYVLDFYRGQDVKVCSVPLGGPITVGRATDNEVTLSDRSISRHHATFLPQDGPRGERVLLRDEGSTNGILVNGRRIQGTAIEVSTRDQIQIGLFRVVLFEKITHEPGESADDDRTVFLENVFSFWESIPLERLRILYEFACGDLPLDEDVLVTVTARSITACLTFDRLCVVLWSPGGESKVNTWTPRGFLGPTMESLHPSFLAKCRDEGRIVVASQARPHEPCVIGNNLRMEFLASTVCVPLANDRGEQLGAIYLSGGRDATYDAEDLKFLVLISRTVAGTIERRRSEAELIRAKDEAEAANRAKSEFLANMSHELRTPLHGVLSFAGFGMKKCRTAEPEKLTDYFQKIHQSGTVLLDLLNDLLDLAKLEAGRMQFEFRPADIGRLMGEVVEEFSPLVADRRLSLEWRPPEQSIESEVDARTIKQVVRNILGNAIKFSPEGGAVSVELSREESVIRLSVRDQGPGIPEDEIETVFDKFVQSSKTKTGAGGTGLGLAISREIVLAHGGRIWAENAPQRGAVFRFELPAVLSTTEQKDEAIAEARREPVV